MTEEEDVTIVHGTGNLFRDLHIPDADVLQARAGLAVEIAKALDAQKLTVRGAQELTGVPAADFSRIRKARLALLWQIFGINQFNASSTVRASSSIRFEEVIHDRLPYCWQGRLRRRTIDSFFPARPR